MQQIRMDIEVLISLCHVSVCTCLPSLEPHSVPGKSQHFRGAPGSGREALKLEGYKEVQRATLALATSAQLGYNCHRRGFDRRKLDQ
jgi:hypothetical protein